MLSFGKRLGIDLGTANSLVYLAGAGIVLNEPTVVAISIDDNKVLAVGTEAEEMLGKTPGNIVATKPLRDGVIADYVVTEAMLRFFLDKVLGPARFFKPEVLICIPAGVTSVEKRAVLEASMSAGAKTAFLIEEPLAAAIGANIPIGKPAGNMIVDIGGGSTEAAVISLGGVVAANSVRVGGTKLDEAIASYLRRKHNIIIGDRAAEAVKIKIGSAIPNTVDKKLEVSGRDSLTGLPKTIGVESCEVTEAIASSLAQIVGCVKDVLEQTPPELASDIIEQGIVISGGTAQLSNLAKLLTKETGVPVHVAAEPLFCVAKGAGIVIENLDQYKRSLTRR